MLEPKLVIGLDAQIQRLASLLLPLPLFLQMPRTLLYQKFLQFPRTPFQFFNHFSVLNFFIHVSRSTFGLFPLMLEGFLIHAAFLSPFSSPQLHSPILNPQKLLFLPLNTILWTLEVQNQ